MSSEFELLMATLKIQNLEITSPTFESFEQELDKLCLDVSSHPVFRYSNSRNTILDKIKKLRITKISEQKEPSRKDLFFNIK